MPTRTLVQLRLNLLYSDRGRVGSEGLDIHIPGIGFVRGFNAWDSDKRREPSQVAGISGCSYLIIRGEIIELMGGLNDYNFMYYDDGPLSWMINLMGYKTYCVPQSIIYQAYGLKMIPQKMFWLGYGRMNALLCYPKVRTIIRLLPALFLNEVLMISYCVIRHPRYAWAKLIAGVSVVRNPRSVLRRRSRVQRLWNLSDFQLLRRFKFNYEWGQLLHIVKLENMLRYLEFAQMH